MKGFRVWGLATSRLIAFLFAVFLFLYPIPYTLYPVHAEVKIGEQFGYGDITSLGQAVGKLVPAGFSIAAVLVIIFFLWGAFKLIQSQGDKEQVAGARQMITQAIIGFIILIFAFLILQFLLARLFGISGFQIF